MCVCFVRVIGAFNECGIAREFADVFFKIVKKLYDVVDGGSKKGSGMKSNGNDI